jgi:hypothetical protein
MNVVVPFFLIAPLFLVPVGLRLLDAATPGAGPPRFAVRAALPATLLLTLGFMAEPGPVAAALSLPWLAVTAIVALAAGQGSGCCGIPLDSIRAPGTRPMPRLRSWPSARHSPRSIAWARSPSVSRPRSSC